MATMSVRNAETPLRRSRANLSVRPDIISPIINDDDAERQQSRLHSEAAETSIMSVTVDKEGLLGCLKIFTENKINKSNAWSMSLIDNFASLVGRHHKSMQDFQFIGTTLDASCKIYGLRVDSVHADVMNMANGLGKFTRTNANSAGDSNETDGGDGNNDHDTSQVAGGAPATTAAAKRKARRKNIARCTLVRNTATINAKLETYPLSEPTFAKLNSTIGDINSSKRLLNYVLSSEHSELKHRSDLPFWDNEDHPSCTLEATAAGPSDALQKQVRLTGLAAMLNTELCMRQELKGYWITNTPASGDRDDDEHDASAAMDPESSGIAAVNQSHIALAFDVNADIEPIAEQPVEYIDTGFDNDDLDQMDVEDMQAICAVRCLRRNATQMDDMRPVDSTSNTLEYSYRPLDNISRFWAGPSYWKIHKPRPSAVTNNRMSGADHQAAPIVGRAAAHQRRLAEQRDKIEAFEFVPDDEFDDSMFLSVRSAEAQKLRKINIYKRWDPKKLRLPTNLHLDRQRFDKYFYAPGLTVEWNKEPAHSVVSQTSAYNYDNADDREYCRNMRTDDDGDASPEADRTSADDHAMPMLDDDDEAGGVGGDGGGAHEQSVGFIGTQFVGSGGTPMAVETIDIPFARRAKVVDMKQLKRCCLQLIEKQQHKEPSQPLPSSQMLNPATNKMEDLLYKEGAATFRETLQQLPKVLSTDQKNALSTATAFYSILHLANEHQLDLISIDSDDFYIRKIVADA